MQGLFDGRSGAGSGDPAGYHRVGRGVCAARSRHRRGRLPDSPAIEERHGGSRLRNCGRTGRQVLASPVRDACAEFSYRQPITRGEIEEVRGVSVSSNILRTLIERDWARVIGHRDVPGRPRDVLSTTKSFLDYFGLKNLDDLPPLADLSDWESLRVQLNLPAVDDEAYGGDLDIPELPVLYPEDDDEEVDDETGFMSDLEIDAVNRRIHGRRCSRRSGRSGHDGVDEDHVGQRWLTEFKRRWQARAMVRDAPWSSGFARGGLMVDGALASSEALQASRWTAGL